MQVVYANYFEFLSDPLQPATCIVQPYTDVLTAVDLTKNLILMILYSTKSYLMHTATAHGAHWSTLLIYMELFVQLI